MYYDDDKLTDMEIDRILHDNKYLYAIRGNVLYIYKYTVKHYYYENFSSEPRKEFSFEHEKTMVNFGEITEKNDIVYINGNEYEIVKFLSQFS